VSKRRLMARGEGHRQVPQSRRNTAREGVGNAVRSLAAQKHRPIAAQRDEDDEGGASKAEESDAEVAMRGATGPSTRTTSSRPADQDDVTRRDATFEVVKSMSPDENPTP